MTRYASVYPLVSSRAVARPFTYEVPAGVDKGAVVSVRFNGAKRRGVVVGLEAAAPVGVKTAPVGDVVDALPAALIDLALWLADYYGSTPARALELVAPLQRKARGERESPAARDALAGEAEPAELSETQRAALDRIVGALDSGGGNFLLHGATGSGKTEVYIQACGAALERGRTAIVLVPEIALAPQTVGRLRARFGDRVAVLHSALTDAERRDERQRIARGEAPVVVGARSAVFAPLDRVGVICVDEEHDPAYKQESDPRYDARTVAAKRAALEGAVAIFGSATPRPESWEALERLELGGRLSGRLPPVRVVDLRREAGYPLSAPLLAELGAIAEGGGKAILLLNRRGVAPAIHCRSCGETRRCPDCDVALVLHSDDRLHCHHCSRWEPRTGALPGLRVGRAGADRGRHPAARARARRRLPRARADPARRRRRPQARGAHRRPPPLRRRRPRGAGRHADGRQRPPLQRCRPGGGRRRRHGARDAGLPRGGAHVPADHAARRAEWARRSGPCARPDVPAGRAADRPRRPPRRRPLPRRGARAPARAALPAVPSTSSGSSPRGRTSGALCGCSKRSARASRAKCSARRRCCACAGGIARSCS